MATERQLEANRANARRSTGPKSTQGKAQSSMNACKHGLTAQTVVIEGEDPAQFDRLRKALEEAFEPRSLMERELVERLAGTFWRLRRIPRFEAALIKARCCQVAQESALDEAIDAIRIRAGDAPKRPTGPDAIAGLALIEDSQQQDTLGKLSRHEAALMNQLTKTYQMLHFIQSKRPTADGPVIDADAAPSKGREVVRTN